MAQFPEIIINSSIANYAVTFRHDVNLKNWEPNGSYFLIDDFFKNKIDFESEENIFWINANEDSKSFIKLNKIFIALKEFGCNRKSLTFICLIILEMCCKRKSLTFIVKIR